MSDMATSTIQQTPPPSQSSLIFIFDQLRTRSHLFHRFLSTHPALTPLWHPYIKSAFLGPERHSQYARNSPARTKEVMVDMVPFYGTDTYESCGRDLKRAVAEVEAEGNGKKLLANEHGVNVLKQDLMFKIGRGEAYDSLSNPTVIPDALYDTLTPIVLIRNPLYQLPSAYTAAFNTMAMRPGDEDFDNTTTFAFLRFLFDDFKAKGRTPIVVDGDDVLWRTRAVADGVRATLGLDAEEVKDEWGVIGEGEYGIDEPIIRGYMSDVLASTGIRRDGEMPGEPEMETEVAKWQQRWGDEVAEQLRELAEKWMPDYEYLRRFKV